MRLIDTRRARARVAAATLVPFLSLVSHGSVVTELARARQDPVGALQRRAAALESMLPSAARRTLRVLSTAAGPAEASAAETPASGDSTSHAIARMQELADELEGQSGGGRAAARESAASRARKLASVTKKLRRLDRDIVASLRRDGRALAAAGVPAEKRQRHGASLRSYRSEMRALFADLRTARRSADDAVGDAAIVAAIERLRSSHSDRPVQGFDPQRLPVRPATPVSRAPRTTDVEFEEALLAEAPAAAAVAAIPPGTSELMPNEDVQITPEIEALAASLGHQPLQIYEWVRNNVDLVPTYGALQGSQMTLEARRGNAFDIATLLIALLRAAGVGARYVTGTIEVPTATVLNWVGGAETSSVAQQILGQGGVPNIALVSGSAVVAIRLEHVWVEAWVDYIPSRGSVHVAGDSWIPMDASFKQHTFTAPSGLRDAVPIEPADVPGNLFTVDESLGRMTAVDLTPLASVLGSYAAQADQYVVANQVPSTLEALVGGQTIVAESAPVFAGSLPYLVRAQGSAVATLPSSLRHYVAVHGYETTFDRAFGSPALSFQIGLPALSARRLGVQFDPATAADAAVLENARASGASSLPVSLVDVVPSVKVDGVSQAAGAPVGMGTSYYFDLVLSGPDGSATLPYDEIAGDEMVFGVTGNGFAPAVVQKRFEDNPVDNPAEYFHQVQLQYWAQNDNLAAVTAKSLQVHFLRLPSAGLFGSPLTVGYLFGSPQTGVYQSRFMDVKQSLLGAAGVDPVAVVAFHKQSGYLGSFLEGATFDQLEPGDGAARGVSSIALLAAAASNGIPIYRITSSNVSVVLPLLALGASTESDIAAAVAAGKSVIVPERNLSQGPWSGVGYIVEDETTGAAAYLISGGINGGGIADCLRELAPKFVTLLQYVLLALLIIALLILLILLLGEFAPILVPVLALAAAPAGGGPARAAVTTEATNAEHFRYLMLFVQSMAVYSGS